MTLHNKLDELKKALPYRHLLQLKFGNGKHDKKVIDWFIKGGHIRTYIQCFLNKLVIVVSKLSICFTFFSVDSMSIIFFIYNIC